MKNFVFPQVQVIENYKWNHGISNALYYNNKNYKNIYVKKIPPKHFTYNILMSHYSKIHQNNNEKGKKRSTPKKKKKKVKRRRFKVETHGYKKCIYDFEKISCPNYFL